MNKNRTFVSSALCIVMTVLFVSCSMNGEKTNNIVNPYDEKSQIQVTDPDTIGISIDAIKTSEEVVNLVIKNSSPKICGLGEMYSLEYEYNEEWYVVPTKPEIYFEMYICLIHPGEKQTFNIDIKKAYEIVDSGHYRIVKEISVFKDEYANIKDENEYMVAVEFDIETE